MSKRDLLLEVGLEELPSRFVHNASLQLSQNMKQWLLENRIAFDDVHTFATPRRLAVHITNVAEKQEDQVEVARGPAKKIAMDEHGDWTKAALGFARSKQVDPERLYMAEYKGSEYVYARIQQAGEPAAQLLPELKQVIQSLSFPQKMRWGDHDFAFARPIRWLVALYGQEIIPMELSGVCSGNVSFGHRFLGGRVSISEPAAYVSTLRKQYVVADRTQRKLMIEQQLHALEKEKQWTIPVDPELLNEVTDLVEYPSVVYGTFDEAFLELPEEVLITSMKEHQRYFPAQNEKGELLPFFITIRNGLEDREGIVSRGNEKVLRARLADAKFFFDEDQKLNLETAQSQLENVIFHEELGTMGDKVRRIRELARYLAREQGMEPNLLAQAERAANLCKVDLITHMVDEFPELQGKMGEIYTRLAGEDPAVSRAIFEHYLPRFAQDELPQTELGAVLGIADKMDTIVSCFSIGLIPSGSQDPYALRRQAAGIVNILLAYKWTIGLTPLFDWCIHILKQRQLLQKAETELKEELTAFFQLRLKNRLQEDGVRYDVIDAVLASSDDALFDMQEKASLLMKQVQNPVFKPLVESLIRVNNLARKHADTNEGLQVQPDLFSVDIEHGLWKTYAEVEQRCHEALRNHDWHTFFRSLTALQQPIDDYFAQVMVMTKDAKVRQNRLNLLVQIKQLADQFADLSKIVFATGGEESSN